MSHATILIVGPRKTSPHTLDAALEQLTTLRQQRDELAEALYCMRLACDEWAAEFTQKKRAMDWGVVNDAYLKTTQALANFRGNSTQARSTSEQMSLDLLTELWPTALSVWAGLQKLRESGDSLVGIEATANLYGDGSITVNIRPYLARSGYGQQRPRVHTAVANMMEPDSVATEIAALQRRLDDLRATQAKLL